MQILMTERLLPRHCSMDDLDEIYRPVFADAVVEDRWSGATGTPAQLQSRFAARHLLPHSGFGLKAVARRDTGRFNSTNRKRARESTICSLKSIPTVVWADDRVRLHEAGRRAPFRACSAAIRARST